MSFHWPRSALWCCSWLTCRFLEESVWTWKNGIIFEMTVELSDPCLQPEQLQVIPDSDQYCTASTLIVCGRSTRWLVHPDWWLSPNPSIWNFSLGIVGNECRSRGIQTTHKFLTIISSLWPLVQDLDKSDLNAQRACCMFDTMGIALSLHSNSRNDLQYLFFETDFADHIYHIHSWVHDNVMMTLMCVNQWSHTDEGSEHDHTLQAWLPCMSTLTSENPQNPKGLNAHLEVPQTFPIVLTSCSHPSPPRKDSSRHRMPSKKHISMRSWRQLTPSIANSTRLYARSSRSRDPYTWRNASNAAESTAGTANLGPLVIYDLLPEPGV